MRAQNIPIVVRVIQKVGFAKLLQGLESKIADFKNIYPFELLDRTCNPKEVLGGIHETIAQGLHEHYVLQQERLGYTPETNPSMVSWEELSEDLKESNRRQADHIGVKLKEVKCDVLLLTDWDAELFQFTPEEVETLAKMEHERWMKDLLEQGWTRGPKKDANKKIHPDLVSWDELPEGEKEKNRNFISSLPKILSAVDLQIYRQNK